MISRRMLGATLNLMEGWSNAPTDPQVWFGSRWEQLTSVNQSQWCLILLCCQSLREEPSSKPPSSWEHRGEQYIFFLGSVFSFALIYFFPLCKSFFRSKTPKGSVFHASRPTFSSCCSTPSNAASGLSWSVANIPGTGGTWVWHRRIPTAQSPRLHCFPVLTWIFCHKTHQNIKVPKNPGGIRLTCSRWC